MKNMKNQILNLLSDKLFIILIVASLFSIYLISVSVGFTMGPDGNEYIASGYQLFQPNVYGRANTYIPPLYPVFLKLLFLTKNLFLFKLFHHYLLSLLTIVLIYLSIKPFDRIVAFVCALITVFDFNIMIYFSLVSTESFYIFFLSLMLFSFSLMVNNPQKISNIYLNGIVLFILMLIRTAGIFLSVFLIPFYLIYFKSFKLIKHFLIAFLIPTLLYLFIWNNIGLVNFPKSLFPLYFAQYNQLLNYEEDENFRDFVDTTEKTYFKNTLSVKKKRFS